jgi:hypothetical protein
MVGTWRQQGSGTLTTDGGGVAECIRKPEPVHVPTPDCSGQPVQSYGGGGGTIDAGIYPDGIVVHGSNTVLHLNRGLYCLDGDLLMNGGVITGEGVTFYMRRGSVQLGGSTSVSLSASDGYGLKINGTEWSGMLILMPYENDGEVHIGGGSGSEYVGTIYAPGPRTPATQDKCIIEGSGTTLGLSSNIICYTIKVAGTADVTINYRDDQNWHSPPIIELSQ